MLKLLSVTLFLLMTSVFSLAQTTDKDTVQTIRVEINRIERKDSCMKVDMNIDLAEVRLIPDCMI